MFTAREDREAARRRRNLLLILLIVGALLAVAFLRESDEPEARSSAPTVTVLAGDKQIAELPTRGIWRGTSIDETELRRRLGARVSRRTAVKQGRARLVREPDVEDLVEQVINLGPDGGEVRLRRATVSATVAAPVVQQAQKNTCESAALEVLAATAGLSFDQGRLQELFPVSGTPDPQDGPNGRVWGDPDRGYVGRPDGGGTAGGFGIYPPPVRRVAGSLGFALDDLSGQPPEAVYRRLRSGRAVMVWIGLSDGPYGEWTSPQGRRIRANFGEHTVVLHGIREDGGLLVSNPLEGTREVWTAGDFERRWQLLDRRALAVR